ISGAARFDAEGYLPDDRGTFLTKYVARNRYLYGRRVDWVTGYVVDGQVVDKTTRTFVIKDVGSVDVNGNLTITCQDPLFLANIKKAQIPKPSNGKLTESLTDSENKASSDNIAEYPSSGWVRIGSEIMRYTSKGSNSLNGLQRGLFGTEVENHSAEDTVQLCWRIDNRPVDYIYNQVLTQFTTIPQIGSGIIDTVQWDSVLSEWDYLQHNYSAIISEPMGVSKLLEDMAEQMQFYPYFDERSGKIKLAAVTPAPPSTQLQDAKKIDEASHIIAGSLSIKPKDDDVITRVYTHHRPLNWAEKLDERKNYAVTNIFAALEEEDENHRRSATSKDIYAYWLNATIALELGTNIAKMYGRTPYEVSFSLDAKDSDLRIADFFLLKSRLALNEYGQERWLAAQVTSAAESKAGTQWDYKALA